MKTVYGMRRANGDWFALKKYNGMRVPVFHSESEAIRARTFNVEMLVFKPAPVDEDTINDLLKDSERPSHFWLVDFGCPTLRRGQALTHAELLNMCDEEPPPPGDRSNFELVAPRE